MLQTRRVSYLAADCIAVADAAVADAPVVHSTCLPYCC